MTNPTLSYCGSLVQKRDKDRFLCTLFADTNTREKLFSLLALYQEIARIPSLVNEPLAGMVRLQWWRDAIEGLYQGDPRNHEVIQSMHTHLDMDRFTRDRFESLLRYREDDLEDTPPENLESLLSYCQHTSSALFHLQLEALDIHDDNAHKAAQHMGTAWALSGILRALRFPTKRLMLPQDMLQAQQLSPEDVTRGKKLDNVKPIIQTLADKAEEELHNARRYKKHIPHEALAIFLPAIFAESYLRRIKKSGYDVFYTDLERHSFPLQLKLLLNAWCNTF